MYKLIATDLDGTLLDDHGRIPAVNMEYIQRALELGVNVALCSGRSYISLNTYERKLGLNKRGAFGICFNGGIVYDAYKNEIISDIRMRRETAAEVLREVKRLLADSGTGIMLYTGADLYTERISECTQSYADRSGLTLQAVEDFTMVSADPSKIVLKGDNTALRRVCESMTGFVEGRCKMFFTSDDLLEFVPLESGKGRGLKILADRLEISMAEVIAVGDQVNDLEMIEAAGLGVAVANAVEPVKSAARYVANADNNAGVIREIVERFIL